MNIIEIFVPVAYAAEGGAEAATGGIGSLGVNWMLFVAQLVNFAIVVWVLKRFAFGPIVKALEERRQRIDTAIKDAELIEQQKVEFDSWKTAEMAKVRQQVSDTLGKAQADADAARSDAMNKTRAEQEQLIASGKSQIAAEAAASRAEVTKEAAELVTMATEKVLGEKMTDVQDSKLIQRAINGLKSV